MQRILKVLAHLHAVYDRSNARQPGREGRPTQAAAPLALARLLPAGLGALTATALALVALATVGAASAAAAPTWLSPVNLSVPAPGKNAYNPRFAVDPEGNAVAVWERYAGTTASSGPPPARPAAPGQHGGPLREGAGRRISPGRGRPRGQRGRGLGTRRRQQLRRPGGGL